MAERVKLYVWGVLYEMANAGAYALLLTDESGKRRLPIVIGLAEARTIAFILEGRRSRRPFTHELMKNTVAAFEVYCRKYPSIVLTRIFFIPNFFSHWEIKV